MTRYEELLIKVTSNPEDDAARLAFAEHIRPDDPDRADLITDQIALAAERRRRRWDPDHSHRLLQLHQQKWTRTLAKYARNIKFDRGFVVSIRIDPYLYL